MSNFQCKVRVKKTGKVRDVYATDNYFGAHQYGYADGEKVYRAEEVEMVDESTEVKNERTITLKIPEGQRAGQALENFMLKNNGMKEVLIGNVYAIQIEEGKDVYGLDTEELEKLWDETFKL